MKVKDYRELTLGPDLAWQNCNAKNNKNAIAKIATLVYRLKKKNWLAAATTYPRTFAAFFQLIEPVPLCV